MQGLENINWYQASAVNRRQPEKVAYKANPERMPQQATLADRLNSIGTGELSPRVNSENLDYYA